MDDELLGFGIIDHDEDEDAPQVDIAELGEGPALDSHGLPHIKEVLSLLRRDVRERHISWLPGKKNKDTGTTSPPIPYIAWPTACDYMDHYALWWDYQIVSVAETTNYYIVHSRVTIHHSNGECPRDGIGWEAKNATGFGGPLPNAESQSIRRALAKFGLARSLYQKGKQPPVPQEVRAALQPQPQRPPQQQQQQQQQAKPRTEPTGPAPSARQPAGVRPGTSAPATSAVGGTERSDRESRFRTQWAQLDAWGWTKGQLMAQFEKIAGTDKFTDLTDHLQGQIVTRFDELIAVESKAQKAQAAKAAK